MATYVFCLVQADRAPSMQAAPQSMPGAGPPRALPVDRGLWAIVADAPLDHFSGDQLERELQDIEAVSRHALAHASVVEFCFRRSPVIPLKLFTLFSEDDRARRHLAGKRTRLRQLFSRVRGQEEWGVRITGAMDSAAETQKPFVSGRDYLAVKKRRLGDRSRPPRSTLKEVNRALKQLGHLATKVRNEKFPPPGQGRPYVVGASFLVKRARHATWKKQAARTAAALAKDGHRLELSGPWPPYHFVAN